MKRTLRLGNIVVCLAAVFALVVTAVFATVFASASAKAEAFGIVAEYIIGDSSIENSGGAVKVVAESDAPEDYGYFTTTETNGVKTYRFSDHAVGWVKAVNESAGGRLVSVKLASDWVAEPVGTAPAASEQDTRNTSFGSSELAAAFGKLSPFSHGRLAVPSGVDIRLDLNGCVVDRKNKAAPIDGNSGVICVQGGKLEVVDSRPTVKHLNGNSPAYDYKIAGLNTSNGFDYHQSGSDGITGGIITGSNGYGIVLEVASSDVIGGVFVLGGGTIAWNSDSGVCLKAGSSAKLIVNDGGQILCNGTYGDGKSLGGGVRVENVCAVTMNGGLIKGNVAQNGGGIYLMGSQSYFTFTGGHISCNYASEYGGGIATNAGDSSIKEGNLSIGGIAEVSGNIAKYGGGIAVRNALGAFIGGGVIGENVALADGYGGGVAVVSGAIDINGGSRILKNKSFGGSGGGVYVNLGASIKLSDNVVIEQNEVYGVVSGDNVNAGGGGVFFAPGAKAEVSGSVVVAENSAIILSSASGKVKNVLGAGVYYGGNSTGLEDGEFKLSGAVKVKDNAILGPEEDGKKAASNIYAEKAIAVDGVISNGAELFVSGNYNKSVFKGYGAKNPAFAGAAYAKAPNPAVFKADGEPTSSTENAPKEYIPLLISGDEVKFVIKDKNTANKKYELIVKTGFVAVTDDKSVPNDDITGCYGISYDYRPDKKVVFKAVSGVSTFNNGVWGNPETTEITPVTVEKRSAAGPATAVTGNVSAVGIYDYKFTYLTQTIVYTVVISGDVSRAITIDLSGDTTSNGAFKYDAATGKCRPTVAVKVNGSATSTGYELEWTNDTNIGEGVVTVKYEVGNTKGTVSKSFDISVDNDGYILAWEYYDSATGEWATVGAGGVEFGFKSGVRGDYSNYVRAKLSTKNKYKDDKALVKYVYGGDVTDFKGVALNSANISRSKLDFGYYPAIRSAGTYSVTISDDIDPELAVDAYAPLVVTVKPHVIEADDDKFVALIVGNKSFVYDGNAKGVATYVEYDYLMLEEGLDYNVEYVDNILGGKATAVIKLIGNYSGEHLLEFDILQAQNSWVGAASVTAWNYGNVDGTTVMLTASPKYLSADAKVHFSVLDANRNVLTVALPDGNELKLEDIAVQKITDRVLGVCYTITDSKLITALGAMETGVYALKVWVDRTDSYTALGIDNEYIVSFEVKKAENSWINAPTIEVWKTGEFSETNNMPKGSAKFGTVQYRVVDADTGNAIYFDSADKVNLLAGLPSGTYMLTASVVGNKNYSGLTSAPVLFRVLEGSVNIVKEVGMPWWGVMLLLIGVLGALAAVFLVLHVKGVLQVLTGKMVLAIRNKAEVDATIAAVRSMRIKEENAAKGAAHALTKEPENKKREQPAKAEQPVNAEPEKADDTAQKAEEPIIEEPAKVEEPIKAEESAKAEESPKADKPKQSKSQKSGGTSKNKKSTEGK